MNTIKKYNPETYWSEVGRRIRLRDDGHNVVAGDDEPYYRYKRKEFLKLLSSIDFNAKSILEIGCGPGGNLIEVLKENPKRLVGVDISDEMVYLAKKNVANNNIEIFKTDGIELPFADNEFDIVFTATVLQHNTDETMLKRVIEELCRVAKEKVFLFERIENKVLGSNLCLGRPVTYYEKLMKEQGFSLVSTDFLKIRASYYISGFIRKVFNRRQRKEGEPLNLFSTFLQKITLPFSNKIDKLIKSNKDVAKLEFHLIKKIQN